MAAAARRGMSIVLNCIRRWKRLNLITGSVWGRSLKEEEKQGWYLGF